MARRNEMPFNRIVVPPTDLASFLRVEDRSELSFTQLQSILYDRLYRSGSVRHLDGSRARRRRARNRRRGATQPQVRSRRNRQTNARRNTRQSVRSR